jgi:regulatory protein
MKSGAKQGLSLTGRAMRLLSSREHSRAELERKLALHEDEPGALLKVLDALQAKGFINEERVLESVVHRRASKLGVSRIKQELQAKGLEQEAVDEAVQALRATELERAQQIWRKKFGRQPEDAAERGKQMRFLASRGFAGDTIRKVVSGSNED